MKSWKLVNIENERKCEMDTCGFYTIINRRVEKLDFPRPEDRFESVEVRVDIMANDDTPAISFLADNYRALYKEVIGWIEGHKTGDFSTGHAGYIGHETARAFFYRDYKQS